MKNLIYFVVVVACVGLIYIGLTHKNEPKPEPITPLTSQAPTGAATKATSTSAAIGQVAKHYRPDAAVQPAGSSSPASGEDSDRNFQVTAELLAKMYLVDTYQPGICYGAPVAVPQIAVANLVAANPPLTSFLKQKYGLQTDLEIYNKLKQLQAISLTETASGKYNFTFMDGQCQHVTYYEGIVQVSGGLVSATIKNQASHTYQ